MHTYSFFCLRETLVTTQDQTKKPFIHTLKYHSPQVHSNKDHKTTQVRKAEPKAMGTRSMTTSFKPHPENAMEPEPAVWIKPAPPPQTLIPHEPHPQNR